MSNETYWDSIQIIKDPKKKEIAASFVQTDEGAVAGSESPCVRILAPDDYFPYKDNSGHYYIAYIYEPLPVDIVGTVTHSTGGICEANSILVPQEMAATSTFTIPRGSTQVRVDLQLGTVLVDVTQTPDYKAAYTATLTSVTNGRVCGEAQCIKFNAGTSVIPPDPDPGPEPEPETEIPPDDDTCQPQECNKYTETSLEGNSNGVLLAVGSAPTLYRNVVYTDTIGAQPTSVTKRELLAANGVGTGFIATSQNWSYSSVPSDSLIYKQFVDGSGPGLACEGPGTPYAVTFSGTNGISVNSRRNYDMVYLQANTGDFSAFYNTYGDTLNNKAANATNDWPAYVYAGNGRTGTVTLKQTLWILPGDTQGNWDGYALDSESTGFRFWMPKMDIQGRTPSPSFTNGWSVSRTGAKVEFRFLRNGDAKVIYYAEGNTTTPAATYNIESVFDPTFTNVEPIELSFDSSITDVLASLTGGNCARTRNWRLDVTIRHQGGVSHFPLTGGNTLTGQGGGIVLLDHPAYAGTLNHPLEQYGVQYDSTGATWTSKIVAVASYDDSVDYDLVRENIRRSFNAYTTPPYCSRIP